jgi:carbon-monoxide dehydrogenase small subunit
MTVRISMTVNGEARTAEVPPLKRLLDVLREDLGLTGTKEGCGEGECGACTVLIDGELACSCLVAAAQVEGARVVTVEGIAGRDGALAPLQRCFVEHGGAQCGICTPGMIVAAQRFLDSGAEATDANVRAAIAGNLCRCTGYQKIVEAIQDAARERR